MSLMVVFVLFMATNRQFRRETVKLFTRQFLRTKRETEEQTVS